MYLKAQYASVLGKFSVKIRISQPQDCGSATHKTIRRICQNIYFDERTLYFSIIYFILEINK